MRILLKNIRKEFSDFVAVENLNLEIKSGDFHFLVGSSGSGKSTTLRMIAGLEKPTSGEIYFDQERVTDQPTANRGIGMMFQNYALWPHMTVYENISYALKLASMPTTIIEHKVDDILQMTQMTPFKYRYPAELSGGQQQRVALARALVVKPRVLMFDEPLSNLDRRLRTEIRDYLRRIHKELGITTIYVTHDRKEALSMAHQVTVMNAGKVMQTASPRVLYNQPNSPFIAEFLGDTNLVEGTVLEKINNETIKIKTEWGPILASNLAKPFLVGEAVSLCIRPEAIKIDLGRKKLGKEVNVVKATLHKTIYLGELEKLQLQPESGGLISVHLFNAPDYTVPIDKTIQCFFKPSKVRVFSANNFSA